jgi:hypothetical protein
LNLRANWTFTGTNKYIYIFNGTTFNIHKGGGFNS